jgi:hypothetical protein
VDANEMSKGRTFLLSLTILGAFALDVAAFHGCSYAGISIGWGQVLFGIALQIVGMVLLAIVFANNEVNLFPDDYLRYGLFRSKWYYVIFFILIGCMLFARGLNHSYPEKGFGLGEKWWSCPKP